MALEVVSLEGFIAINLYESIAWWSIFTLLLKTRAPASYRVVENTMSLILHFCTPPTPELSLYAAELYARRETGVVVSLKEVEGDGEMPIPNFCHGNVEWWTMLHPDWSIVRGWLFIPISGPQWSRFVAHSVVQSPSGELCDITPQPTPKYAFLTAGVPEEKFTEYKDRVYEAHGAGFLDHSQPV